MCIKFKPKLSTFKKILTNSQLFLTDPRMKAKQAWCLLASWLVSIVLCLGDQSICFTDFDHRDPSKGVNLRGPQTLNIPNCHPPPKSV